MHDSEHRVEGLQCDLQDARQRLASSEARLTDLQRQMEQRTEKHAAEMEVGLGLRAAVPREAPRRAVAVRRRPVAY